MDDVTKAEIERIHDEDRRQNARIDLLEKSVQTQQKIAMSVEKLAFSMEQMLKEQEKQGERLEKLEQEPATRWNTMTRTIFTSVISTVSGGLAVGVIMLIAQYIK